MFKLNACGQRWRQWSKAWRAAGTNNAAVRIRRAARWCIIWGALAVAGGLLRTAASPEFGGDAYTEMVERLAAVSGGIAWLAAVVLFVAGALLRALADILDEQKRSDTDASVQA